MSAPSKGHRNMKTTGGGGGGATDSKRRQGSSAGSAAGTFTGAPASHPANQPAGGRAARAPAGASSGRAYASPSAVAAAVPLDTEDDLTLPCGLMFGLSLDSWIRYALSIPTLASIKEWKRLKTHIDSLVRSRKLTAMRLWKSLHDRARALIIEKLAKDTEAFVPKPWTRLWVLMYLPALAAAAAEETKAARQSEGESLLDKDHGPTQLVYIQRIAEGLSEWASAHATNPAEILRMGCHLEQMGALSALFIIDMASLQQMQNPNAGDPMTMSNEQKAQLGQSVMGQLSSANAQKDVAASLSRFLGLMEEGAQHEGKDANHRLAALNKGLAAALDKELVKMTAKSAKQDEYVAKRNAARTPAAPPAPFPPFPASGRSTTLMPVSSPAGQVVSQDALYGNGTGRGDDDDAKDEAEEQEEEKEDDGAYAAIMDADIFQQLKEMANDLGMEVDSHEFMEHLKRLNDGMSPPEEAGTDAKSKSASSPSSSPAAAAPFTSTSVSASPGVTGTASASAAARHGAPVSTSGASTPSGHDTVIVDVD